MQHRKPYLSTLSALLLAAGLATPAMAAVTIGGSMETDILLEGSNADGFSDNVQLDVEPRIFFQGDDKLDNGSSVIWKIWTGAENYRSDAAHNNDNNSGNGSRSWGNREAWGGWKGDWGSVRLGKIYSPSYLVLDWPYAAQGGSMHVEEVGLLGFNIDNSIVYDSPNLNGFTFSGMYALRTQQNQGDGNEYFADLTGGYSGHNASINVGYQQAKARLQNGSVGDEDKFAFIAGGYTFGDSGWTVRGGYKWWDCSGSAKAGAAAGTGDGFADNVGGCNYFTGPEQQQAWLQGMYTTGKHSFSVGYNYFWGAKDINGNRIDDSDSQTLLARYTYALSKNTSAYFDTRFSTNDTNGTIGATYGTSYKPGTDSYRLLIGTWTGF
ncbi:porin [Jeongeupia naejangsanensis]|uniref:Porin n=1 Tax=Jeongeupia naejangsanensis TaxID=613195 RepID=A0ABS2BQ85_9NEIS|nr:porin [Jeongeupia naejangsanensis]MBM3116944.1 porin [Jeongeupia naejangsanensis]